MSALSSAFIRHLQDNTYLDSPQITKNGTLFDAADLRRLLKSDLLSEDQDLQFNRESVLV